MVLLNKRNITIFEANYVIDTSYKLWFDSRYVKNDKCISTHHSDAYDRMKN